DVAALRLWRPSLPQHFRITYMACPLCSRIRADLDGARVVESARKSRADRSGCVAPDLGIIIGIISLCPALGTLRLHANYGLRGGEFPRSPIGLPRPQRTPHGPPCQWGLACINTRGAADPAAAHRSKEPRCCVNVLAPLLRRRF